MITCEPSKGEASQDRGQAPIRQGNDVQPRFLVIPDASVSERSGTPLKLRRATPPSAAAVAAADTSSLREEEHWRLCVLTE